MLCPNCREVILKGDLYCRQCGVDVTVPSTSLVPVQNHLPAALHNPQLPRVAASVGALALGVGIELLRRSLLARTTRPPHPLQNTQPIVKRMGEVLFPQNDKTLKKVPKHYEIEETVIYMRRVIRHKK
jgi:hypothetical protein